MELVSPKESVTSSVKLYNYIIILMCLTVAERGSTLGSDGNAVCKLAEDALSIHYKWLFRCAQNICIGCQTRGVFLAGDNQVQFLINHFFLLFNSLQ